MLRHTGPEKERKACDHHHTDDFNSRNTSKKLVLYSKHILQLTACSLYIISDLFWAPNIPLLGLQTLTAKQDQPDS